MYAILIASLVFTISQENDMMFATSMKKVTMILEGSGLFVLEEHKDE